MHKPMILVALCLLAFVACFCFGIYAVRNDSGHCMLGSFFVLLTIIAGRSTVRGTS